MADFEIEGDESESSDFQFLDSSFNDSKPLKAIAPKSNVGGKLGSSLFGGNFGSSAAGVGVSKFQSTSVVGGGGDEYDYDVQGYTEKHGRRSKGKAASPVEKEKATKVTKAETKSMANMSAIERAEAMMSKYSGKTDNNPSGGQSCCLDGS